MLRYFTSILVLLFGLSVATAEAFSESEMIEDSGFRRGLILWEPKPGQHVKYGELPGLEKNSKPVWGLSQWSSKFPLAVGVFMNRAKIVAIGRGDSDLSLGVDSAAEYGPQGRKRNEPWVHLLVEQEFSRPPFLREISAANFHLEARLLRSTNLHRGDYNPGLHAAQFQVFFTVQNRNPKSAGHGDILWFGIPVYDSRHRQVPEFKSKDFGGTEKFIFTPAGTNYTSASAHDGGWITIDRDLRPLMHEALELAWARGFLAGSTNISDYAIGGMNMGWELPGTFDVELEVRKLSLKAVEKVVYQTNSIEGWRVLVDQRLFDREAQPAEKALELLRGQLREIVQKVPSDAVRALREVTMWFSPEYAGIQPKAEYHPSRGWLRDHKRNELMGKCIEFTNVRIFEAELKRMPNFALHELAHAYHDQVLAKGFDNAEIKKTFEQAKQSGAYDRVKRWNGEGRPESTERAYAMVNPIEYFAETSEAFFSRNDFYPFDREELKLADPAMYSLLLRLWGVGGSN